MYRFQIRSTGASSVRYGNCEICDKPAAEVFYQSAERAYFFEGEVRWAFVGASMFGHEECLRNQRKNAGV